MTERTPVSFGVLFVFCSKITDNIRKIAMNTSTEHLNGLLDWSVALAREAGDIMRAYFDQGTDKQVRAKSNRTPVTIADEKINDLVIKRVARDLPDHGVLGEEASSHRERKELWVCDPIDGTEAFILGEPVAMFSLAFVADGTPVVAVLYEPVLDKMFTAAQDQGAWLNGVPMHVSKQPELSAAKIAVSPSPKQVIERQAFFKPLFALGTKVAPVHGCAYRAALVAQGIIDGSVFPGRSAHDMAAAKLIIEEAGGKVTDLYGREQRYDGQITGAILSNGRVHEALVRQMAAFGPEQFLGY